MWVNQFWPLRPIPSEKPKSLLLLILPAARGQALSPIRESEQSTTVSTTRLSTNFQYSMEIPLYKQITIYILHRWERVGLLPVWGSIVIVSNVSLNISIHVSG